jgi:hypothetical protein
MEFRVLPSLLKRKLRDDGRITKGSLRGSPKSPTEKLA